MPALTNPVASLPSDQAAYPSQEQPKPRKVVRTWPPSLRSQFIRRPRRDDLLGAVSAGREDRILVIGDTAVDTLCKAMHRGCRGASSFRTALTHPDLADVVIAPAVRTPEVGQAFAACARHALAAGGRLALRTIGQEAMELARGIATRLRISGFEGVRLRGQTTGTLVLCRFSSSDKPEKAR